MLLLDFLLAFAILMVAFSTVVSGLVEALGRIFDLRSRNLKSALDSYLEEVLYPTLSDIIGDQAGPAQVPASSLEELREQLLRNVAVPKKGRRHGLAGILGRTARIDRLSPEALVQRLATTPVGAELGKLSHGKLRDRLDVLALGFDRYMACSAERYRRNSHIMIFLCAMLVAFLAQINFGQLVTHLYNSPKTIEAVIAAQDELLAGYDSETLVKARAEVAAGTGDTDSTAATADRQLAAMLRDIDANRAELATLQSRFNLPFGTPGGAECDGTERFDWMGLCGSGALAWLMWVLNVTLSGVLIGLGGPFWYRLARQLGQVRLISGALTDAQKETVSGQAGGAQEGIFERNEKLARLFQMARGKGDPGTGAV